MIDDGNLARPEDDLFSKYGTEDKIRKGLDRLVTASLFERDANENYQPTGWGLMHGVMRRQLPQPYHGVAVSLAQEWRDRWEN